MKTKSKTPKRADGTLNDLSAALHLQKRRISTLLTQGMPSTPNEALAWRRERTTGDITSQELRAERIRLVRSTRERVDLELACRRKELVSAAEVDQDMAAIGSTMKAMLQRIENDLPPVLDGMSPAQIKSELRIQHGRMLDQFTGEAARLINSQRNANPNK